MKLHHLGIAVRSLAEALGFYRDSLGLEAGVAEEVPSEGVRVAFLPVGDSRIELLEPLSSSSPIARHLEKRGEGIHHVCFSVPDIEDAVAQARSRGAEIIEPAIRIGAGGHRIAFIHPRTTHGVLIELKEQVAGRTAKEPPER